jgi:hypothetical protein
MSDWPWESDDRRLADAMSSYWTNFAKTERAAMGGV